MSDVRTDHERMGLEIGKIVDRYTKRNPHWTVLNVCGTLGFVAGTITAVNIPPGNPEADMMTANVIGMGYAAAMEAARKAKAI